MSLLEETDHALVCNADEFALLLCISSEFHHFQSLTQYNLFYYCILGELRTIEHMRLFTLYVFQSQLHTFTRSQLQNILGYAKQINNHRTHHSAHIRSHTPKNNINVNVNVNINSKRPSNSRSHSHSQSQLFSSKAAAITPFPIDNENENLNDLNDNNNTIANQTIMGIINSIPITQNSINDHGDNKENINTMNSINNNNSNTPNTNTNTNTGNSKTGAVTTSTTTSRETPIPQMSLTIKKSASISKIGNKPLTLSEMGSIVESPESKAERARLAIANGAAHGGAGGAGSTLYFGNLQSSNQMEHSYGVATTPYDTESVFLQSPSLIAASVGDDPPSTVLINPLSDSRRGSQSSTRDHASHLDPHSPQSPQYGSSPMIRGASGGSNISTNSNASNNNNNNNNNINSNNNNTNNSNNPRTLFAILGGSNTGNNGNIGNMNNNVNNNNNNSNNNNNHSNSNGNVHHNTNTGVNNQQAMQQPLQPPLQPQQAQHQPHFQARGGQGAGAGAGVGPGAGAVGGVFSGHYSHMSQSTTSISTLALPGTLSPATRPVTHPGSMFHSNNSAENLLLARQFALPSHHSVLAQASHLSHVSAASSSIGIGVAAIPHHHHGGGSGSGSGSGGGARPLTTGGIVTSSHGSGISLHAFDATPSLSVSPMTGVPHYHTTSNLSQLSLAFQASDMKGNSSNNSYSAHANLNINNGVSNGNNNNSINSMNNGFGIFDLPTNLISYIFSFSDIKSLLNIEKCCKTCCVIGRYPSSYHNSVFFILTRMMNGHKSLFRYSHCKTVCIMLNICLLFDKIAINRYLIPQLLNFQFNVECFTLYNLFPSFQFLPIFYKLKHLSILSHLYHNGNNYKQNATVTPNNDNNNSIFDDNKEYQTKYLNLNHTIMFKMYEKDRLMQYPTINSKLEYIAALRGKNTLVNINKQSVRICDYLKRYCAPTVIIDQIQSPTTQHQQTQQAQQGQSVVLMSDMTPASSYGNEVQNLTNQTSTTITHEKASLEVLEMQSIWTDNIPANWFDLWQSIKINTLILGIGFNKILDHSTHYYFESLTNLSTNNSGTVDAMVTNAIGRDINNYENASEQMTSDNLKQMSLKLRLNSVDMVEDKDEKNNDMDEKDDMKYSEINTSRHIGGRIGKKLQKNAHLSPTVENIVIPLTNAKYFASVIRFFMTDTLVSLTILWNIKISGHNRNNSGSNYSYNNYNVANGSNNSDNESKIKFPKLIHLKEFHLKFGTDKAIKNNIDFQLLSDFIDQSVVITETKNLKMKNNSNYNRKYLERVKITMRVYYDLHRLSRMNYCLLFEQIFVLLFTYGKRIKLNLFICDNAKDRYDSNDNENDIGRDSTAIISNDNSYNENDSDNENINVKYTIFEALFKLFNHISIKCNFDKIYNLFEIQLKSVSMAWILISGGNGLNGSQDPKFGQLKMFLKHLIQLAKTGNKIYNGSNQNQIQIQRLKIRFQLPFWQLTNKTQFSEMIDGFDNSSGFVFENRTNTNEKIVTFDSGWKPSTIAMGKQNLINDKWVLERYNH